jgi:hypothetical protein
MIDFNLLYKNLISAFFCESFCECFGLNQAGLYHYIPVAEPVNIMPQPDESFCPSPAFYPYRLR